MDEKEKSLAQNGAVSSAEAPEEANKAEAPQEGGMSTEAAQEPTSAPTEVVNEGQKPGKKGHKGLIIGIIVAVVLVIGAAVAWMILSNNSTENKPAEAPSEIEEGKQDGSPREEGEDDEIIEVGLADVPTGVMEFYRAMVRSPYNDFNMIRAQNSRWNIYIDPGVARGDVPRDLMIEIANGNLDSAEQEGFCWGDYFYNNDESQGRVVGQCTSGDKIRKKIKEIFDVDIVLNANDRIGSGCGKKTYNAENDEFYTVDTGCGGNDPRVVWHWPTRAERNGDEIRLYETAVYSAPESYATIGSNIDNGEIIVENWNDYTDQNGGADPRNITDKGVVDRFSQYVWKLKKGADGEYVFEGLEKVK